MNKKEIKEILHQHGLWLNDNTRGQRSNLQRADLRWADLQGANLPFYKNCPPTGSFTAWKKGQHGVIIKLEVPTFARRCSCLTSRKCGCDIAYIESIEDKNGNLIDSCWNWNTNYPRQYKAGSFISSKNYNPDIRNECTSKIHFFITREEAEAF